ncbi:MAG: PEP-CTERM sorting domain-containing protein [Acidobacteriia bacterium]|nr:PEP-CTERM sorting domain-containing protein [Terriglobia bacterium]
MKRAALLIVMCVLLMPMAGLADTFDFNVVGASGNTWSWAGGILSGNSGNNFTGSDPATNPNYYNPNVSLIVNGIDLSVGSYLYGANFLFTTGAGVGLNGAGEYVFAPGGSITVTNDDSDDCGGAPCFTGTFVGSPTVAYNPAGYLVFDGVFVAGDLSSALIATVAQWNPETGIDPNGSTQALGTLQVTLYVNNGAFIWAEGCGTEASCGRLSSGELAVTNIPEPGSLMLFGTGLLGLAGFLRRKLLSR